MSKNRFRFMIVLNAVAVVLTTIAAAATYGRIPVAVRDAADSWSALTPVEATLLYAAGWALTLLQAVSLVGLFLMRPWARWVYLVFLILWTALNCRSTVAIGITWVGMINAISLILCGAILATAFDRRFWASVLPKND